MSDDTPTREGRRLPIDRYPDPVAGYATDDESTVTAVNDAFETELGPVEPGSPVAAVFERLGVESNADSPPFADLGAVTDTTTVSVETDAGEYIARILPPTDQADGFIVFVDAADSGAATAGDDSDAEFGMDRVASVISHDLRNPLDVAKARLRAGREGGDEEHFEHVAAAHDRMERIIEDVLTLSRGEAFIEPADAVDLVDVAESAWATVETEAATLTVADDLPTTTVDRDRAERLFENLFRNAVEHGDDPEVVVGRLDGEPDGFYVADDGPGIPQDERSAVFDPGYTTHDHGTGLGLAIVERIATAHGWHVAATAGADGGVCIEVRDVDAGADG